jgi:hypothetical protein
VYVPVEFHLCCVFQPGNGIHPVHYKCGITGGIPDIPQQPGFVEKVDKKIMGRAVK